MSSVKESIARLVVERPGLTVSDAARALGVDHSTAAYHLRRLVKQRRVAVTAVGRVRAHWAPGCGYCPVQRAALPRLTPEARRVFATLAAAPRAHRIGEAFARAAVDEPAGRWAVDTLRRLGLVMGRGHGLVSARPGAEACVEGLGLGRPCGLWSRCAPGREWPWPEARSAPSGARDERGLERSERRGRVRVQDRVAVLDEPATAAGGESRAAEAARGGGEARAATRAQGRVGREAPHDRQGHGPRGAATVLNVIRSGLEP
ncbi:MAG TPA: hypothetical protein VM889_06385 [Candidatus Thermoplasmatota archaeon]|nr:hypothetical protein [Candidatus Thermoplasmatota archaeon]